MSTHKALAIHTLGEPPKFIERPTPAPKGDEILLKVSIATGYKARDHVFAFGSPFSPDGTGTQEYCIVPAWQSAPLPKRIRADEAATFPLNAMTMVFALFHETGLNLRSPFGSDREYRGYDGDSILIIGGGSATGQFGVQLARLAKFRNIIVVASKSRESQLRDLGATTVIDRALGEFEIERQIREVVGDDLVFAIDCVGRGPDGQTLGASALSNHKKGALVALVHLGGVDDSRIGPKTAGYVRKAGLCHTTKYPDITKAFWAVLAGLIENSTLKPTGFKVVEGLDVERVDAFLDNYTGGVGQVKPHIHIGSTFEA
ncbi:hypothetical protein LQW54_004893 [Pestalotiopsis sp. IQ-011]